MPTYILGISAYYHDSAACLVQDGEIVAAAQEERFTRKKHDPRFPVNAIRYCLSEAGIELEEVSAIAFYDKPLLKFERLLETYLSSAPIGIKSFLMAMPVWLKEKLMLKKLLSKELEKVFATSGKKRKKMPPLLFGEHHESHAASAFYPSPFESAAVLCIDGVGEWATTSAWLGNGREMKPLWEIKFPHSLGLLYSAFTYYTGFKVNSGEYKVMGLAPYGRPVYVDEIMNHLLDVKEDGTFRLNMEYFDYCTGLKMTNEKFNRLFGGPPRKPESEVTQKEMDLARSIQEVTEEIMLRLARSLQVETGAKNLCLAGGVALNCVGNGRILREGPFENIWIQPAAGDAGGAIGVAMTAAHRLYGIPRVLRSSKLEEVKASSLSTPKEELVYSSALSTRNRTSEQEFASADNSRLSSSHALPGAGAATLAKGTGAENPYSDKDKGYKFQSHAPDAMKGSYLGPAFSNEEIESYLKENSIPYHRLDDDLFFESVANQLADERVIGWFQGRMEFGPRALGGRSIIGDPRSEKMQSVMNLKIKYRESFRPFAPSVMRERVSSYFELDVDSPYMLLVAPVRTELRIDLTEEQKELWGIELLNVSRSTIPAITHVDYSARVQTVDATTNPRYHRLIETFEKKTGCAVLINTSFNVRGEPIVCTPHDAYRCFMRTEMDALVLENCMLIKEEQPNWKDDSNWKEEFELD